MRVKRGIVRRRRHTKLRKLTKGYRGSRSRTIRKGKEALMKAGQHAFRDRRKKKRDFRSLWIVRLNAAVRPSGLTYSTFMSGLKAKGIALDRKALSELAIHEPAVFEKFIKEALAAK